MDPTCTYGGEPGESAPEWFKFDAPTLTSLIPGNAGLWASLPEVMGGLPIGLQRTADFCTAEVLTAPASKDDWALVTGGFVLVAMLTGAFERVMGDIKRQVWNALCVCAPAPLPDPPPDHDGVWCGHAGPFAPHTSGTWTITGVPEGIVATEWILYAEGHPLPAHSVIGSANWINAALDPNINFPIDIADYTAILGMEFDGPQPPGGEISGTYTAGDDPLEFSLCVSGAPADPPPYDPGIPEIPDPDPPTVDECTLDELCAKTSRIYVQGFSTLIEVLRNQGLLTTLGTKVDDLQESADSILVDLANISTVVLDVQSKVGELENRVELARRDANYLRRTLRYDNYQVYGALAAVTGEGNYGTEGQMIGAYVYLDVVPDWVGFTGTDQKAYYHLGYVQFNQSGKWGRKFPIVSNPTVYTNVPPLCSEVHYWLAEGVTATIQGFYPMPDEAEIPLV